MQNPPNRPTRALSTVAQGAAFTGILLPFAALADPPDDRYGYHMMDGGWFGMGFGILTMVLVIAAIVVLVVLAVRWIGGPGQGAEHRAPPRSSALDILKERFARGEIDAVEYRERRQALEE